MSSLPDFHIALSQCLNCHKKLDGATAVSGEEGPNEGDVTVCIYCGHLMAFDADQRLRNLTDEEMVDGAGNSDVLRIQRARGMVKP